MKTKKPTTTFKGWRKLRVGETIKDGDRCMIKRPVELHTEPFEGCGIEGLIEIKMKVTKDDGNYYYRKTKKRTTP